MFGGHAGVSLIYQREDHQKQDTSAEPFDYRGAQGRDETRSLAPRAENHGRKLATRTASIEAIPSLKTVYKRSEKP